MSGKARKTWEQDRKVLPYRREHDADAGGDGGDDPLTQKDTPATEGTGTPEPPTGVKPMPRLVSDVKYLVELLDLEVAPRQRLREKIVSCFYLPGDASGLCFGSALIGEEGIKYEAGTWDQAWREESSNFREVDNLVCRIDTLVGEGSLGGREVFIFTDNFVFESTYNNDYSKLSPKLSDTIMHLHKAERDGDITLHVIRVAGTRMKSWGVDGLSRGDLLEGMMGGQYPLSFIPLSIGANERSSGRVKEWVDSSWSEWSDISLTEVGKDEMFELKDMKGGRLWMPPPAAMETVIELFNEDRIAHPQNPRVCCSPPNDSLVEEELGERRGRDVYCRPCGAFWGKDPA